MARINPAVLTIRSPKSHLGGVETFVENIHRVFPESEIFSSNALPPSFRLPIALEPQIAWSIGRRYLNTWKRRGHNIVIANGLTAAPLAFAHLDIPLVTVFHGNYAGYIRAVTRKLSPIRVYALLVWGAFEYLAAHAGRAVAVSKSVQQDLARYYGIDSVIVHNGVDTSQFVPRSMSNARRSLRLPEEPLTGLFVGRPTAAKGFDRFIETANRHRNYSWLAVLPNQADVPICDLPNLIVRTNVPHQEMVEYYNACDFLFAPTKFEGCSFAAIEGMACGLPIVTSRTGIFRDSSFAIDGVAILHDFDAASVDYALSSLPLGTRIAALRELVLAQFSLETFDLRFRQVIQRVIEQHASTRPT